MATKAPKAPIELAGGVTVRTFTPPPDGFDPIKADDRHLLIHGYPRRPDDPDLRDRWESVLSRPFHLIEPTFRPMPERRRRLPIRTESAATVAQAHGVENTDIWSGAVVHAPKGDSFTWVEGTWTVPNAFPPVHASDGVWYSASTWVGIDGIDGSGDVLQAGCDSDVMTFWGSTSRQLRPWWEWFPAGSFWISNLPVAQGDTLNCLICVTANSTTSAEIFMYNLTSGIAASFAATAPSKTALLGNSAEWVVERLEIDTSTPELARYGEVYFDECNAGTLNHQLIKGGTGNTINMTDGGSVISTGTIETPSLIQVKYTGPNS